MGRLGAAGDGVGTNQPEPRVYRVLAAIRRARWVLSGQSGGADLQLAFRRPVPDLGLAQPVPDQHHHGRDRAVDPARHTRDTGLPKGDRRRAGRTRAGAASAQASAQRGRADRAPASARAGAGLYLRRFCLYLWHDGAGRVPRFLVDAVLVSAVLGFLWVTVAGHLSDRIGRKRMYIIGCVFVAVFGFVYFAMLDTK